MANKKKVSLGHLLSYLAKCNVTSLVVKKSYSLTGIASKKKKFSFLDGLTKYIFPILHPVSLEENATAAISSFPVKVTKVMVSKDFIVLNSFNLEASSAENKHNSPSLVSMYRSLSVVVEKSRTCSIKTKGLDMTKNHLFKKVQICNNPFINPCKALCD
jgi:hypothetical protein